MDVRHIWAAAQIYNHFNRTFEIDKYLSITTLHSLSQVTIWSIGLQDKVGRLTTLGMYSLLPLPLNSSFKDLLDLRRSLNLHYVGPPAFQEKNRSKR